MHSTGVVSGTCLVFGKFQPRLSAQFVSIQINYFPQYLHVILFSNFLLVVVIISFYFSVILYSLQSVCVIFHFKIEEILASVWCLISVVEKSEEEPNNLSH